jgi:septal ring factor EnvC (AmiA/AmiB activator)
MPRKSLRPNLNQIRAWVRQGRTDAWVAHQLEVSVRDIEQFKRQNDLVEEDATEAATASDYPDEIDLRAEDDALIAAELEAAEAAAEAEAERARAEAEAKAAQEPDSDSEEDDDEAPRARPRRRRGGRGRRVLGSRSGGGGSGPLEGTFDHGEEGYGLWLDPAIQDNPIYAEHWAGHRPVEVAVEEDCIIIRRTAEDD